MGEWNDIVLLKDETNKWEALFVAKCRRFLQEESRAMEILCEKLRHSGDRKVAIDVLWFLTPEQLKEIFPTLIFLAGLIAYAETAQKLIRSIGLPWVSEHTEAEVYRCLEDDPADEQAYRLYLELYIYLRMTSSALKLLEHLRTSERLDLEEVYADYKERIYALLG